MPKSFKFTDASISSLEPEAGKRDIMRFDTVLKGFGVRVGRSGAKTFILQTRTHTGRAWRTPLGRYPALNVPQARTKAKKLIGELAGGRDPFAEREQKRDRAPAYMVRMAIADCAHIERRTVRRVMRRRPRGICSPLSPTGSTNPRSLFRAQRLAPSGRRGGALAPKRARPGVARSVVSSRRGCAPCIVTPSQRAGSTPSTIRLWR